jgi:hypothetical protein
MARQSTARQGTARQGIPASIALRHNRSPIAHQRLRQAVAKARDDALLFGDGLVPETPLRERLAVRLEYP